MGIDKIWYDKNVISFAYQCDFSFLWTLCGKKIGLYRFSVSVTNFIMSHWTWQILPCSYSVCPGEGAVHLFIDSLKDISITGCVSEKNGGKCTLKNKMLWHSWYFMLCIDKCFSVSLVSLLLCEITLLLLHVELSFFCDINHTVSVGRTPARSLPWPLCCSRRLPFARVWHYCFARHMEARHC